MVISYKVINRKLICNNSKDILICFKKTKLFLIDYSRNKLAKLIDKITVLNHVFPAINKVK